MDIELVEGLSPKSRGILYRLLKSLSKQKISLEDLVCRIFEYRKTKFNLKQFHLLIQQYDPNLMPQDIDALFSSLDDSKNSLIFLQTLQSILSKITEQDNPKTHLNRTSKIQNSTQQNQKMQVVIQFKDLLLASEDYLEVVCLFVGEDGLLSRAGLGELCGNFGMGDAGKREILGEFVFGGVGRIGVKEFLGKLGLDTVGMRVQIQDNKKQPIKIQQQQKSQYIKNQQKSRLPSPSISISSTILNTSKTYNLQNIPAVLQPYFNYGSQLEQPFASFAIDKISRNQFYIDEANPTYSRARRWVHIFQINPHYQLFQVAKSIIRRDNTRKGLGAMLEPKDIIQGGFGDCYFLSAVAAIVQDYPQLVYRLFVLEKNPSHLFGVKLFIDGVWNTIPLDGCFPMNNYGAFCGAQPHHNEIWVMLLEKAWAKVYKSYENIHSGYNEEGLLAISGAPSTQVSSQSKDFLRKVMAQFGKGAIITCATSRDVTQLTEQEQENLGVFAGHAYTLLKVYENLPYKNSLITLIKIRNPWGKKGWKGDWSFKSQTWTKQLRQKVGYEVDPQDGTFFVSLADFVVYFDHINISKVNLAYRNSHVTNFSSRFEFYENRFVIKDKADYFFTLYQENGRKFRNMATVYEKSKSWMYLAKITKKMESGDIQSLDAIACVSSTSQNSTIQTTLEPGEYMLISKVSWKHWREHEYTITSYGPSKLTFTPGKTTQQNLLQKFATSRSEQISKHDGGKVSVYDNLNISKRYDFNIHDGIGFISITNFDSRMLETTIYMDQSKGLSVMFPYSLPLALAVMPYETTTVGFVVDPAGFNYSMREKYFLRNLY